MNFVAFGVVGQTATVCDTLGHSTDGCALAKDGMDGKQKERMDGWMKAWSVRTLLGDTPAAPRPRS